LPNQKPNDGGKLKPLPNQKPNDGGKLKPLPNQKQNGGVQKPSGDRRQKLSYNGLGLNSLIARTKARENLTQRHKWEKHFRR
jgi:hypothetical protein